MSCGKCGKIVSATSDMILCSGFCGLDFHYDCCGIVKDSRVDRTAMNAIRAYENILYFCSNCKELMKNYSFISLINKISSLTINVPNTPDIIDAVTTACSDVTREVCKFVKEEFSANHKASDLPQTKKSSKPARSKNPHVTAENGIPAPVPYQYIDNNCIVGSCDDDLIKAIPEKKFVYASRFAVSTTPDMIRKHLSTKLQVSEDELKCYLLAPANQDISKYNYVSFKIGVSPDIFNQLLSPEIWPKGVPVREFINHKKNFQSVVLEI